MKIDNIWGDLSDMSAKKEALAAICMSGHRESCLSISYSKIIESKHPKNVVINFENKISAVHIHYIFRTF